MKVTLFAITTAIMISGCATSGLFVKKPTVKTINKSQVITMRTKKFAFSDTGFYKNDGEKITIQAYNSGVGVGELKFYKDDDTICVGKLCNTKKWFNDNFLSPDYPQNLIVNVLDKKPILEGAKLIKTADGFSQNIGDIQYVVTNSSIYFKDRANRVIIKLKDMN